MKAIGNIIHNIPRSLTVFGTDVHSMTDDIHVSRRRVLAVAGAAVSLSVAGCIGDDDEEPDDETDEEAWEGVDEIVLEGWTQGWEGVEPAVIEGETNPTLVLFEGETYEITWENMDGDSHNIVLLDDAGEHLEETELMSEEGETQTLEFEATDQMVEYYCEPHAGTMIGDVEVV